MTAPAQEVSTDEVRQALSRILASSPFCQSVRMSRFLRHAVEATLAGETDQLKEVCVGMAVFDRPADYNPKLDPVVRNEARRLRTKLEQYYAAEGLADRVRISIPRGGYVALFEWTTEIADPAPRLELTQVRLPPPPAPRPKQWRIAVAAGAILLIACLLFVRLNPPARQDFAGVRFQYLTSLPTREIQPAISPDGQRVAYSSDQEGTYAIHATTLDGQTTRLSHSTAKEMHPAWSPDGRLLAFLRSADEAFDLVIIPVAGGAERKVARIEHLRMASPRDDVLLAPGSPGPAWSPDGSELAFTNGDDSARRAPLQLLRLNSGRQSWLTHPAKGELDFYPAWSPDGKWLAFSRMRSNSTSGMYLIPSSGGAERQITRDNQDIRGLAWMPDGRSRVVSSNHAGLQRLWQVDIRNGDMIPLPTAGASARDPAVSRDGKWLVYSDYMLEAELWQADLKTGAARNLLPSTRQDHSAQYSPDGKSIAFVSDRSGSWELWTMLADGTSPRQITHFEGPLLGTPHWSPDGKYLAFDARPAGHSAIFVIPALGGAPRPVEEDSFEDKMPSWSHDGRWIYFNSDRGGTQQLWKIPAMGGKAVRLTGGFAADSLESADGKTVWFLGDGGGIHQVSAAGGPAIAVPEAGPATLASRRIWSISPEGIWFGVRTEEGLSVRMFDFANRHVRHKASLENDSMLDVPGISISPDGAHLIYSRRKESRSDLLVIHGLTNN